MLFSKAPHWHMTPLNRMVAAEDCVFEMEEQVQLIDCHSGKTKWVAKRSMYDDAGRLLDNAYGYGSPVTLDQLQHTH